MRKDKTHIKGQMLKSNRGRAVGRARLAAKRVNQYNPKGETVACLACGRDTNNIFMLCDKCS